MQALLITRGSRGMALFQPRQATIHIPIFGSDEVADVTGAGDTVNATFGLALAAGASFYEAARLANYAGGLVVMKRGTATISARELADAVTGDHDGCDRKLVAGGTSAGAEDLSWDRILTVDQLVDEIGRERAAGRTIALANGCFDLLHVGHVRYLQGAAAEADRLVVAVNDDRIGGRVEGTRTSDPAGVRSGGAGRGAPRGRLRRDVRRAHGRTAAQAHQAGRPLQGNRLHRSTPSPSDRSYSSTAGGRRSSAIRRITRRVS